MKTLSKNLFKLTVLDTDYLNTEQNKIELVGCKYNDKKCESVIAAINSGYNEAISFRQDKDYYRAINVLKTTFDKTFEIREARCLKCSNFFRSVITHNLEDIHDELKKMSTGIFKTKRFVPSYLMAGDTLEAFNSAMKRDNLVVKQGDKSHKIHRYEKKVS